MSPTPPGPHASLVHRDRRLDRHPAAWARTFDCRDAGILIVGRGPVRREAIEVFREMGITRIGILLSERDSIVYPRALAPEVRMLEPARVHRVADYTGATREERETRMREIAGICHAHGYDCVFAGYGFMAEDADFVRLLEQSGIRFIGPCARVQEAAGRKDEAKRTALRNRVSITPGVNHATVLTLLERHPTRAALVALALQHGLEVPALAPAAPATSPEELAEAVIDAAGVRRIDLFSIDDLAATLQRESERMLTEHAGARLRLKAVGGGGGKGQRIYSDPARVPALVREILQEVKATSPGDDKNLLLELNIEDTRHNEIQMLGNGEWCVTLGGRDCSLQMHEQKLVEISITEEALEDAIGRALDAGRDAEARALTTELASLRAMEEEAERFGRAVGLDSAATFECIVRGGEHFFMEVNTRIQVEHRVTELCYALRFTNPADPAEYFDVHSLVEAMVLVALHGHRLPRPARIRREGAAIEVRLNATDRSLAPHAGGVIVSWSDPSPGEIRDDQGICIKNADTGLFMHYRLAGAYDSNIALLLATGPTREAALARVVDILRRTTLRGRDLATNLQFLHGLTAFFAAHHAWAQPGTRFVAPYLAAIGALRREADRLDLPLAWQLLQRRLLDPARHPGPGAAAAARQVLEHKETLLLRPLQHLIDEPHLLSAWLSRHRTDWECVDGRVAWLVNPVEVLASAYDVLHMLDQPGAPAAHVIWDHDLALLAKARAFYAEAAVRCGTGRSWIALDECLRSSERVTGFEPELWERTRAAHAGYQLGLELLAVLPLLALDSGFHELRVRPDLSVEVPERLADAAFQAEMRRVLAPPPEARSGEIAAVSGGIYYAQEAPGMPPFVTPGAHFNKGDSLYIVEVMKMFNKVPAPFAGTVDEVLLPESGVIVQKGQVLLRVTPDEPLVPRDPAAHTRAVREFTTAFVARLLPAA
jgi:acetyl/propionyl-CoA carboxylase alpha subunit